MLPSFRGSVCSGMDYLLFKQQGGQHVSDYPINEVLSIKSLVESNIENNKTILKQLEKSLLLMEFNQEYMKKFLNDGTFTKKDLLDFYTGEDVKDRYRLIEKQINEI